jgi:hypothetical protein
MSKRKNKNASPIKVIIPIVAVILIAAVAIGAIYFLSQRISFDTETSTVFILDKGKVVTTDIEAFDTEKYSMEELTSYLTDIIDTYNAEHGEESVIQKEYLVENNVAKLILEYANTDVYEDFYGIELFSGTISEALEAGYTFDVEFARVSNDKAEACDAGEITTQPELKVAIIKANTRVCVEGKILYLSADNVYEYGKNYVVLKDNYNIFDLGVEEVTETETQSEEVDATTETMDDTMIMEDGVPVDSTETTETESTEIIFDFGDEEVKENTEDDSKTEVSMEYIYIIYK